ncbi:MAG: ChbG/HpnK family deacetylase, partial [Muribaculaceae bacterium]|nr:ChbG/HpnK family deacetylase [Muribaculaceae bacterium]
YKNGVETAIEVMAITPWFPEAARLLRENPGIDVGLHLAFTSEWDNVKWRPLTSCPSLTDSNGYFLPMMFPNKAYPGLSIMETKWDINEIEQEARAQIELALKNIPQISHISGHMGSMMFAPEVVELMKRLSEEYNLPVMDCLGVMDEYGLTYRGYDGPSATSAEKEAAFIKMLDTLEPGKKYLFLDHPALDNEEMQTVGHIGYENVAVDRQGVTDLFTSPRVKQAIEDRNINLISYNDLTKSLPRGEASPALDRAFDKYLAAVKKCREDLHSIMIVKDGKVVKEQWLGDGERNTPHVLNSVSKTFTSTAVGFAVAEGLLNVNDKVISFFPDKLPAEVSDNLKNLEVRHLLTMSSGHDVDPTPRVARDGSDGADWVEVFLATPLEHEPGSTFVYNSLGTYVLSAIVQKVTGQKVIDYLYPRLFRPLGIVGATWQESPQGINCGGWGLYLKTEDLAKMGQLILQKGEWNGKQIIPASWIKEATTSKIESLPAGARKETLKIKAKDSDWLQGYGYQMWRCRHNGVRADGAAGQYIIVLPDENAVIATTAKINDMQEEINLIWKYLLPALK